MSDVPKGKSAGSSAKRCWPLILVLAGLLVLLAIAYWLEYSLRRGMEAHTRRQMAEVKAGKTTVISDPAPEMLGELVNDRECADKITEVEISELTGRRISDKRFRDLKSLPHLRTIRVMYVRNADSLLANIKGMRTLEELWLYHSGVTVEGMGNAADFPRLKRLHVGRDRVDDQCLDAIKRLQKASPNCEIHLTEDE